MRTLRLVFAASIAFSTLWLASAVIARPITRAEITGKKICWDSTGVTETYSADGKYASTGNGEGVWQFMSDGVVAVNGNYRWSWGIDVQKDGRLIGNFSEFAKDYHAEGHFCK